MIKHFCDFCGKEIDQKVERKNKQINNLKIAENENLPEIKVLKKVTTGEMVNYRGMDICDNCAEKLSNAVAKTMESIKAEMATEAGEALFEQIKGTPDGVSGEEDPTT